MARIILERSLAHETHEERRQRLLREANSLDARSVKHRPAIRDRIRAATALARRSIGNLPR